MHRMLGYTLDTGLTRRPINVSESFRRRSVERPFATVGASSDESIAIRMSAAPRRATSGRLLALSA